ncbi:FHA domain-containing protein [Tuwongella immobilis]|uniref:FHA domain-containing protein n=1 Tax=Tuwongella immobilis TaxID=692036 RepID=A0A6C2YQ99_9BACT|nr:FHA domain-containing protein [Tuwongella immobilis]VIP03527.1 signal peptide protein : FHA domain-containing protein OS=Fimbriimonas ginsengisoli Gsoil 348 GN=OP10G_2452 PE=4 SV=1: FHA [Tuwongella immobilis]VTS04422.1 signal peptide protein : FHA domain-containing protein OS=Fimbriimonas ginsengisoli Gsoil 348 GN=OP10G_2452 PE=4 SV=1: FHA [Tuwongella immobilis]
MSMASILALRPQAVPHALPAESFPILRLRLLPSGLMLVCARSHMVLGRHSSADIRIPMPDISRRHCRFDLTPAGWRVIDLSSLNGVILNDRIVSDALLRPNDRLRIGNAVMDVELPEFQWPEMHSEHFATDSEIIRSIAASLPE